MSQNYSEKHLPKWPLAVLLIIPLLLFVVAPICRSLYTMAFIHRQDKQLATLLKGDLEELGFFESDKEFVFIGSLEEMTNASCIDLSNDDSFIYSIFDCRDTKDLTTVEASIEISNYLNQFDFQISPVSLTSFEQYEEEITDILPIEKTFPWYNAIVETEHFIVIQLSF